VKYRSAEAFRTALEERLRQRAAQGGTSLARLRKHAVFDRLLTRLVATAPGRWILKGALALDLRFPHRSRATKDMDLGRVDDEEHATADLLTAAALDLGDFFVFRSERARDLDDVPEGAAVRYRVRAELAGRRFEDVVVDVGFSTGSLPPADKLGGFGLLDFAGLPPVEIPVISLARHVAEKVHAYTRVYRDGRFSSRVKDLVDIAVVASSIPVLAADLREALEATFRERSSHSLPNRLPPPPKLWRRPYAGLARNLGLPSDLENGHSIAAQFVDPVLKGRRSGRWDPRQGAWSGT
jgi:predicted nucleotidyltransferase component of viral defense system